MDTLNTVSRYTNEQAIEDGFKKRVENPERFDFPVAVSLTSSLFELLDTFTPEQLASDVADYGTREALLLTRVRKAVTAGLAIDPEEYFFKITHTIGTEQHEVRCILDGDGFTIMLPSDY